MTAGRGAASSRGRAVLWALTAVAVLAGARVSAVTWLQLHNTLHHNGNWTSGKIGLARSVMGAGATMVSRTATVGNALDLGAWFGFQDFAWHEPLDVAEIALRAKVTEDRYMHVWFGGDGDRRVGVRLSKHDRLPTAWWVEGPDGLFTEVHPFTPTETRDWNDVVIRLPGDGAFQVELNGHEVAAGVAPVAAPGWFGVRGGMDDTYVDDVAIVTRDGRIFTDDFANHRGEVPAHLVALLVLTGLCGLAVWRRGPETPAPFPALATALVTLVCAVIAWQLDTRFSWPLYPDEDAIDYGPYPQSSWGDSDVIDALIAGYGDHPGPVGGRLLFMGTSQTQGSGASTVDRTWVARVCASLNASVPADPPAFECLNSGLPGSKSPELWKLYRDHWSKHAPDLVVIDLGNNDDDEGGLDLSVRRIAEFNQERGIETFLVLEPTTSDVGPLRNASKHEILREVARALGLPPPSEVPAFLYEERGRGNLWWDFVHPTDAGHLLLARKVAEDLLPVAVRVRNRAIEELAPADDPSAEEPDAVP